MGLADDVSTGIGATIQTVRHGASRSMAVFKNYYQALGVADFAEADVVKAAYRKLARQHHPDLNAGNPAAEERFKEINEAYETLSDPDKRGRHDLLLRTTGKGNPATAGPASKKAYTKPAAAQPKTAAPPPPPKKTAEPHAEGEAKSGNLGDFFESFLKKGFSTDTGSPKSDSSPAEEPIFRKKTESAAAGARPQTPYEKPRRGEDVIVKTIISPQEATDGVIKTIHVQHHELCRRCSGTGKVNGTACTACDGEKVHTRNKKMDVRIPPGVKNSSRVRVAKEGGRGAGGAESGDLFLQIEISVDTSMRVEGLDVHADLAISVTDAVLGAELEVNTLNGSLKMTVPPGTQSGNTFRLKDRGVQSGLMRGDHFVTVTIATPENLTARERELYQELARLRPERPTPKKKA